MGGLSGHKSPSRANSVSMYTTVCSTKQVTVMEPEEWTVESYENSEALSINLQCKSDPGGHRDWQRAQDIEAPSQAENSCLGFAQNTRFISCRLSGSPGPYSSLAILKTEFLPHQQSLFHLYRHSTGDRPLWPVRSCLNPRAAR